MTIVPNPVNPAPTGTDAAEAELRERAAERVEANPHRYIALGIDPWVHAANLRAVALRYRQKAAG